MVVGGGIFAWVLVGCMCGVFVNDYMWEGMVLYFLSSVHEGFTLEL